MKTITKPYLRWLIRRDFPAMLAIERAVFEFPWPEAEFISRLRQRNCLGMAVEARQQVVGFMLYELNPRDVYVTNFAVHPDWQRCGVGSAMVDKLVSKLSPEKRTRIVLEVRETNLRGLLFFKAQGFLATGLLRGQFDDSPEDAVRMERRLGC